MDKDQLAHRFKHHPPTKPEIALKHDAIRKECGYLAELINQLIDKECREKSLALTAVEECMMWSNAAIARELNYRDDS